MTIGSGCTRPVAKLKRAAVENLEHARDIVERVSNQLRYKALADSDGLLWVNPALISRYNHLFLRKRRGLFVTGLVRGGDWDRAALPLANHPEYRSAKAHFVDGVPWDDMAPEASIDADARRRWDQLYESIETSGVLPDHPPYPNKVQEGVKNIIVFIGRDGELIFSNRGFHRLCVAKFLDLERIPVNVLMRHTGWQDIREAIAREYDLSTLNSGAKQYLNHPDVADLLLAKSDCAHHKRVEHSD
jgi:hypothetical protein